MGKMKLYKSMRKGLKSNFDGSKWKIGEWRKTDCTEICIGFNCSKNIIDAMSFVDMEILAEVQTRGITFISSDKQTSEEMKIDRAWKWDKKDSVMLAIYAAELVIDIFEKQYPNDKRPRNAIEAAKTYLKAPNRAASAAAGDAAWAARAAAGAASAAGAAAWAASAAAGAAAWAARDAAGDAARAASAAAGDAARAASAAAGDARDAAGDAARAARAAILKKCHKWILNHIENLEEIK
jgi:hypothetical protein